MQEKIKHLEVKVGLLILIALIVLGGFIFILGNFSVAKGFAFYVDFAFSGNLQKNAPIKVAGIKVGKIEEIEYRPTTTGPTDQQRTYVRVKAWVEQRAKNTIFRNAEFFINTQGVFGEQYLEIVPGDQSSPPIAEGDILRGVTPPRMDLVLARLYETLDAVTSLLREDKETIRDLLKAGASVAKAVDLLLVENKGEIKSLLVSLDRFTAEGSELLKNIRQGVGQPEHLKNLLTSMEKTTESVSRNIDALLNKTNKALDGISNISEAVGPAEKQKIGKGLDQLVKLSERLSAVTEETKKLVDRINRGQGTAGALLVKEELYEDLKEMVRDLKRNPWKFLWRE